MKMTPEQIKKAVDFLIKLYAEKQQVKIATKEKTAK
jgi:hypothetical protein